jgi:hypothetical protein
MTYLDAFDAELRSEGIPGRRRRRIVAEFAEHLHEDPHADLGAPRDLARQFADELGTRLARRVAVVAFAGLAVTGVACAVTFLVGTRVVLLPPTVHQVGVGSRRLAWLAPLWAMSAQVAFAAGVLALLRVWRLRRVPVITGRDAQILYRRVGVGLLAGVLTAGSLPLGISAGPGAVYVRSQAVGAACLLMLLMMLVFALQAGRLRPSSQGAAGDLRFDLGTTDPRVTPWRVALALSAAILVAVAVLGIAADDPYDGLARGLLDGAACLAGFIVLGRYLGLRTAGKTAQ